MDNQAHPPGNESSLDAARSEHERLRLEHGELESRLEDLKGRVYLSAAEEVEKKTLQKLKLAKKDRMAELESMLGAAGAE